ncbi:hypothetical protein ABK040_000356 [Willaertia magna]
MVNFTLDQLEKLLFQKERIRNISVIAHVDHGKSTLTDSLAAAAGFIDEEVVGEKRVLDIDKNEIEKGITIKSTNLSFVLNYPNNNNDNQYVINLIDCPGHVDFSSEVTAALRVSDGAMVVVDAVEGCRSQTETVLRQALQERIKVVLMINKVDRLIEELQQTPEECYQSFVRIIENVNVTINTYGANIMSECKELIGDIEINPIRGNVAFGSGKMGWGFTLLQFAEMYSEKFKMSKEKVLTKLWGDNYYDYEAKRWTTKSISSKTGKALKRGFCEFVIEPIFKVFEKVKSRTNQEEVEEELEKMIKRMNVTLKLEDHKKDNKTLLKTIMRKFLPASNAMTEMIVLHLPSPVIAQQYRYSLLYTGDLNDKYAKAIKECDSEGPLIMFVSKMIPMSFGSNNNNNSGNSGRFIAFGRVFAGTISQSSKVRIMGPAFEDINSKKDVFVGGTVQRTLIMMGKNNESVAQVPAGNVLGVMGIDKYIVKTCTLTNESNNDCYPIRNMKYSVNPVVQIAVEPESASDIQKLAEGLKKLAKSDPLVECRSNTSGQHIIAAAGELHLEICLKNLEDEFCKGVRIKKSQPVVNFMETVSEKCEPCLSKTANSHNRLYFEAEPLSEEFIKLIEDGTIGPNDDLNKRCKLLETQFGWEVGLGKKIWCFGPLDKGPNIVVNMCKSVDFLNEIQDYVVSAFQQASLEGALCGEPMRGIRFNLFDAQLHADSIHRGAGQIIPAAQKAFQSSQLRAKTKLVEPIYLVEIQCPEECMGSIYGVITKRRGTIIDTEYLQGTPLLNIKCYIPVVESFGLTEELRSETGGQAFPQCTFDHWKVINQDIMDVNCQVNKLVRDIRKRKGDKEEIPNYTDFLDYMNR